MKRFIEAWRAPCRNLLHVALTVSFIGSCFSAAASAELDNARVDALAQAAIRAQAARDWSAAEQAWKAAYAGFTAQRAGTSELSAVAYEYGRILGINCFYEEAQARLRESLALDERLGGPVFMPLSEIARLYLVQGRFAEAIPVFERAVTELDKVNAAGRDADSYAEFLDEYAKALTSVGRAQDASVLTTRIEALRVRHTHTHTPDSRTPYGINCAGGHEVRHESHHPD